MEPYEEVNEFLAHHGIKGMHWGVRKERVSNAEIHRARSDQRTRRLTYQRAKRAGDITAAAEAKRIHDTHPDKAIAALKTTKEKANAAPGKAVGFVFNHPIASYVIGSVAVSAYRHRGEIAGTAVIAGKVGKFLIKQAFASKDSPAAQYASLGRQVVQGFVVG